MCLAIPARITEIFESGMAKAEVGGIVKEVNLSLIDEVAVGDYVIVHVGFAIAILDETEARQTLEDLNQLGVTAS